MIVGCLLLLAITAVFPKVVEPTLGVDVSQAVSKDAWQCMKGQGVAFAIVRIGKSDGKIDDEGAQTIKNAHDAGIEFIDGYVFACQKCGDPQGQMRRALDNLSTHNASIGQVWIDVEDAKTWSTNGVDNVQFLRGLIQEAEVQNGTAAIYTSASQWEQIMGNNTEFAHLPLWYSHYDDQQNFKDFSPFGGWQRPALKQFQSNQDLCDVKADKNWYP